MRQVAIYPVDRETGLSSLFLHHVATLGSDEMIRATIIENCRRERKYLDRKVLTEAILAQYKNAGIEPSEKVMENIEALLQTNVFTITSGHQLCVAGGPLFVLHKIAGTVKLCRALNENKEGFRFVPVHWMASEDHDVEEIQSLSIDGNQMSVPWEQKTPAYALRTDEVQVFIKQLSEKAGHYSCFNEIESILKRAYAPEKSLTDAHREWLHALTKEMGVVLLDGNDTRLKARISVFFKKEWEEGITQKQVLLQNQELENAGFHIQAHVRDVNFFLLENNRRERIARKGNMFTRVSDGSEITADELLRRSHVSPADFSPNALMRPLYQCHLLPDVAFMGGPAEIAYWLQLDKLFASCKVVMPVRLPRPFVFYVTERSERVMNELGMQPRLFFAGVDEWKKSWLSIHSKHGVNLASLELDWKKWFDNLAIETEKTDPSLVSFVRSGQVQNEKFLQSWKEKMIRSEKRKYETAMSAIIKVHSQLFPNGAWQERSEPWLRYLLMYGKNFSGEILENLPAEGTRITFITG